MDIEIPDFNQTISFGNIVFVYQNCYDYGHAGKAWICFYDGLVYGPCTNRNEVFQMFRLIICNISDVKNCIL